MDRQVHSKTPGLALPGLPMDLDTLYLYLVAALIRKHSVGLLAL
jgi:hypothetical protein